MWYLRINGKQQHHLIVGAFVDLHLSLSSSSSSAPSSTAAETSTTTTTTSSSSTTATTTSVASDAVVTTGAAAAAAAVVEHQRGGVNHVAPCSSCYYGATAGDVQVDVEAAVEGDD